MCVQRGGPPAAVLAAAAPLRQLPQARHRQRGAAAPRAAAPRRGTAARPRVPRAAGHPHHV